MDNEIINDQFKIIARKKYYIVLLLKSIGSEGIDHFKEHMTMLFEAPSHVVINCCCLSEMSDEWIDILKTLKTNLKALEKKILLVFLSQAVREKVEKSDLSSDINTSVGLLAAIEHLLFDQVENTQPGAKFLRAFVMSAIKTMLVQGKTLCHRNALYIKKQDQNQLEGVVSGIINVQSELGNFAIIISFPEDTYLKLISRMIGEEITELSDEIRDGATEILNIIYGQAKAVLNEDDAGLKPEIPLLIPMGNFSACENSMAKKLTNSLEIGHNIVVPFHCELGKFAIRFWFKELETAKALINTRLESESGSIALMATGIAS
ncbi:MAG: chemotaxis protein CheX [Oligoflexia bacterium]|nr:chemotaxis protein CheX [Oligoflexia bacterium]MBF0366923.1 chemotaxis protein CheX [Oligoflexia bacterium]